MDTATVTTRARSGVQERGFGPGAGKMPTQVSPSTLFEKTCYLTYDSLPDDDHIRILELLPGQADEALSCTLHCLPLAEAVDTYEALSYVWGDAVDKSHIIFGNSAICVTQNLADALTSLRYSDKPRRLWADAVCINQNDNSEKGHQLRLMGDVYRSARQVVVWLGRDTEWAAEACFKHLEAVDRVTGRGLVWNRSNTKNPEAAASWLANTEGWEGMRTLLLSPWFQRTWVVQEAAVAKRCILMWGRFHLDILQLTSACARVLDHKIPELADFLRGSITDFCDVAWLGYGLYPAAGTWKEDSPVLREFHRDYAYSVAHVLNAGRLLKASIDTDHVYAFLGNPMFDELRIEADYAKPAAQVFTEVASAMFSCPRDAPHVLPFVNHSSDNDVRAINLPSWVPKWSDPGRREAALSSPRFWYNAGGKGPLWVEVHRTTVTLDVHLFDSILWTSEVIRSHNFSIYSTDRDEHYRPPYSEPYIEHLWVRIKEKYDALKNVHQGSKRGISLLYEAFSTTLLQGQPLASFKSDLASSKVEEDLKRYHEWMCRQSKLSMRGQSERFESLLNHWLSHTEGRRLALTQKGRLCLVPFVTKPGDVCCIAPGSSVPLILRLRKFRRKFNFVGAAFINGVMNGEVFAEANGLPRSWKRVTIA